ncbi:hypothetical protein E1A91_A13G219400v1 [Gossypium mustelinum]|uniref:Solute carrier family 25 member 44-like n=4 Tax=Gossypium TaxID=3633 RepID=A0A5J5T7U9_GOSBA|nr:hypothetical protein ES319_A13G208800v1 [Gossypium barbadense]TYG87531.1 hypothetical protein ES288_A13G222700v1 [Gossypium darwinii]TYH93074.1 hypothetical protein ES332_A13G227500v1 [Gossypium tomentosum]TYJ02316.1 hypothetical protein E1A91_A13G219400v1 [Gossypium mustelinum]
MKLSASEDDLGSDIHVPADIDWHMLDKSKFFFLGAAFFSGVSAGLYPAMVLKTRQQVSSTQISCFKMSFSIMRCEGLRGFYRGFGTTLMGTIPARALYMGALEVTKTSVGSSTVRLGFSDTTATAIASAAAGLSSAMAAQLVWTPIDVVSQRLMVQAPNASPCRYKNGLDAFRKILFADGLKGLYRGFGISMLTYAPSNAVWWASYSVANRLIYGGLGWSDNIRRSESKATAVAVQGLSAAMASGVSALITTPLDTIKTRLQVLDKEENGVRKPLTMLQTVRNLVKESGLAACYRGLGPRWASMSLSATTMITTYELLKRLSAKNQESLTS